MTGKLEWESSTEAGLDQLIGNSNKKQEVGEWFKMYQQGFNHNIIFENAGRWKRLGATHCLPHPTRTGHRLDLFRETLREFTLDAITAAPPGGNRS